MVSRNLKDIIENINNYTCDHLSYHVSDISAHDIVIRWFFPLRLQSCTQYDEVCTRVLQITQFTTL